MEMLQDIYWAEKSQVTALTAMSRKTTSEELGNAFVEHVAQTEDQVYRLEKVFGMMGREPGMRRGEAMAALISEANGLAADTEKGSMTRDVALIAAGQKIEHYEIAAYGTLVQLASTMHLNAAAGLLEQSLREEKEADMLLTDVAEHDVNWQALENGGHGEVIQPLEKRN